MCDSDDDEFLSASEGEYEESEKDEKSEKVSTPSEEVQEVKAAEATPPEESFIEEAPVKEESSLEKVDTGSSQESLLEDTKFSSSRGSGSDSQPDSLSSEKQRLLEEVVKETFSEETREDTPKREQSVEKSLDEGGWDDFDMGASASLPKKDEPVKKTDSTENRGWDDWGQVEETPGSKKSTDGWNEWSLIDEKKVTDSVPKKAAWLQEPEPSEPAKKSTGWGWGGIVSAVGEKFTSTIESSLGLPSAEEVAQRHSQQQKELSERLGEAQLEEVPSTQPAVSSGFGMLSGLVSGGIDVLESIGKKTFEVVTVKDEKAGRRRMLFAEESGQNLSDVLRELREKQDREVPFQMGSAVATKQIPDVASQFGRSEGMAHLEALEMLSSSRPKAAAKVEREYLGALSEVDLERAEDGDFGQLLAVILKRIDLPYEPKTLIDADTEISTRLAWCEGKSSDELFSDSVQSLVDFTASSVQVVSKLANLLLILRQDIHYWDFVTLFELLAQRANFISSQYTEFISMGENTSKTDDLVTQTHVECSTAIDFIQQAHRLLAPMFHSL